MSSPTMRKSDPRDEIVADIRALFAAARAAGIPVDELTDELAGIIGVERVSIYRWRSGSFKPMSALTPLIRIGLQAVRKSRKLP